MKSLVAKLLFKLKIYKIIGIFNKKNINIENAKKSIEKVYKIKEYESGFYNKDTKDYGIDLSIVMPIYDSEKYLEQCLDSLLNQNTKYSFEVIAVNDGSTDNSLKILEDYCNKFKNNKISLNILNQKNIGASNARRNGILAAKGNYIGFIDADDYVEDDFVELMLKNTEGKIDIVKCNFECFDENGIVYKTSKEERYTNNRYDKAVLECHGFAWNGIYKKEIVQKYMFPKGYIYEDMIIKLAYISNIKSFKQISNSLYHFRKNKKSTSRSKSNYCNYKVLDQVFLPQQIIENEKIEINKYNFSLILNEFTNLCYFRIRKLPVNIKKSAFMIVAEFTNKLFKDEYYENLSEIEKELVNSFKKFNYLEWKYLSLIKYLM